MTTVLNAVTFAATPAMNAAISATIAIPSIPWGKNWAIRCGIAVLYWTERFLPTPRPWTVATAIRPGRMMIAGRKIFGYAAISGVRRAADRFLADRARCTSAKFVVQ